MVLLSGLQEELWCKTPSSQQGSEQPRPDIAVKIGKTPVETLAKTYHNVDMLQPLPQQVSPSLPNLIRSVRMCFLPDGMQTGVTKANGTEEVVEEMQEWTPTEVRMV